MVGVLGGLRWYYNGATQSCQSFDYLGDGGNANNFLTKEQCESYCLTRCTRGQPQLDLTLSLNNNLASLVVSCSTRTEKGSWSACDEASYECSRIESLTMCCPLPSYICSSFGGVGPIGADTTPTPYSIGSNRLGQKEVVRWFWDTTTKTCQPFRYLGQGGNFNNFLSEQECIEYCSKSLCPHGVPLQENGGSNNLVCSKNSDCPTSHVCTSTVCCPTAGEPHCQQGKALRTSNGGPYYPCSLSSTSTQIAELCPENYECVYDGSKYGCCPTREYTCRQQKFDIGTMCNPSSSMRWYFDEAEQRCKTFQYNGCDGNSNNFATQRDCEDYCRTPGLCPENQQVYIDSRTYEARRCIPNIEGSCPSGWLCSFSAASNRHFCCGQPHEGSTRLLLAFLTAAFVLYSYLLAEWHSASRYCNQLSRLMLNKVNKHLPTRILVSK
uniref:BPTI/Kunitz inhibitor domain-containing protein n=1 Tax=Plectus sambesii TaxID=2011161 RepID=A0A914W4Q4_9BILA